MKFKTELRSCSLTNVCDLNIVIQTFTTHSQPPDRGNDSSLFKTESVKVNIKYAKTKYFFIYGSGSMHLCFYKSNSCAGL